jgi:hypothetical protein
MDPKVLLLLPGLASCPMSDAHPTLYISVASARPARKRPEPPDLPERDHPPHGEGSSESPIYLGVGSFANNNTASGRIIVDSSASGTYTSTAPQATWLAGNFSLAISMRDFDVEPFVPTPPTKTIQVAPDTTKHLANPSTLRALRSYGRRRR